MRKEQAKQDWQEERKSYRELKGRLLAESTARERLRWIRNELQKIDKHYKWVYEYERGKHRKKIEFLKKKYEKRQRIQDNRQSRKKEWVKKIAEGAKTGRTFNKPVPIYGEIEFDEDEMSILGMNPKHHTLPVITEDGTRYESTLCNVKLR